MTAEQQSHHRPADRATSTTPSAYRPVRRFDVARHTQQAGLIGVIALLALIFQSQNDVFLSSGNIIELLRSGTLYFIVACAATMILVAGGLDFSVGSLFALGGVIAGLLMEDGIAWPVAVIAGIGSGVVLGLVNAAVSVYARVPPLIATLGMFFTAGGLAVVISGGNTAFEFPKTFTDLGQGSLADVPYLVFYAIIIGLIFHVLLEKTVLGYNARATGGNRAAAAANGIRVARLDLTLYAISGGVAALAGILAASRLGAASPAAGGSSLTFQVLTAAIIGGTSLFGGTGTIAGSALGALLFAVINSGLAVINVDPLYQNIFIGIILVLAVTVDQFRRQRRFRAPGT